MSPTAPSLKSCKRLIRGGVVLAFVTVLTACGSSSADDAVGGMPGTDPQPLEITTPANGATVGPEFVVAVRANVRFGAPSTGLHHLHLYYDGQRQSGKYDIVYATSTKVTRLAPGRHTIEAAIANPDHSLTSVKQLITVTVGTGEPSGSQPPTPPATSNSNDGY
jgi:hypothetical protein